MEDAHTHLLSAPDDKDASFFAVYDGHGGAKVAQYAGNHLHKRILKSDLYSKKRGILCESLMENCSVMEYSVMVV